MKTTEEILKRIKETGIISKSDMRLLMNRSNKENKDLFDWNVLGDNEIVCDEQIAEQGRSWLKSLLKKNGEPKKGITFGYREINIVKDIDNLDFYFKGFYDDGCRYHSSFRAIFSVGGMDYIPYCNNEKIYIIG